MSILYHTYPQQALPIVRQNVTQVLTCGRVSNIPRYKLACKRGMLIALTYGERHTVRWSGKAAESNWHVRTARAKKAPYASRCKLACIRAIMSVPAYGERHTVRWSGKAAESNWHVRTARAKKADGAFKLRPLPRVPSPVLSHPAPARPAANSRGHTLHSHFSDVLQTSVRTVPEV